LISLFLLPLFFSRFWQDFCLWWISDCTICLYVFSFWSDMLFNSYYHGYSLTFCDLAIPFPILVETLYIAII
jgi:hypothetical protein